MGKREREGGEEVREREKKKKRSSKQTQVRSKLEKQIEVTTLEIAWLFLSLGGKALSSASFALIDLATMSQTLDRARKLASRLAGRIQSATATQNASSSSSSSSSSSTLQQLQQTRAASSGARPGEPTPSVKAAAGPHGVINVSDRSGDSARKGRSFSLARFYLCF